MTQKNRKSGSYNRIILVFLLFGPAFLLIFISTRGCKHKFKELEDFGNIPAYSFKSLNNTSYNNESFKGNIVLFTTIQLTCPDSCATSLWHFDQIIYQHIRKNKKKLGHVKIVSFLTDGSGNPIDNIDEMYEILNSQIESFDPEIWILAKGDSRSLYDFSNNGKSLLEKGDEYFGGEAYQELLLLADKSNHLRMVLSGKSEGMIRRMKQHIALLQKEYDKMKEL
jgi:hypothetical protein